MTSNDPFTLALAAAIAGGSLWLAADYGLIYRQPWLAVAFLCLAAERLLGLAPPGAWLPADGLAQAGFPVQWLIPLGLAVALGRVAVGRLVYLLHCWRQARRQGAA